MAVTTTTNRNDYTADGTQTVFAYTFKIFQASDLDVYVNGALQDSGYTVSGAGNPTGGNVTFTTAPASGSKITLIRDVPYDQQTVFVDNDKFPADSINNALDKLTILTQQLLEKSGRAVSLPVESTLTGVALPTGPNPSGKLFRWNSAANNLELVAGEQLGLYVNPVIDKGDLLTHDGNTTQRLPVGPEAAILTADPNQPSGLKWGTTLTLADQGEDPTSAGTLQRNGGFLRYHTGASVRTLNPPEAITLRRDGTNQWRLYDETGAEVDISASTTSGLQEAINLAWARGRDLKVLGGGGLRLGGGTLPANPFSTVTGSTTVTVNHPGHGFTGTDVLVHFLGSTAVNGIPASEINSGPGTAHQITIIDANTYTFTVSTPATATGSGGGPSVTWTATRDVSVLNCTSTVTFPPMHTKSVFIDSLTINFPSSLGANDGIVVDSCMSVDMDLRCQIAYAGTGAAVRFKPTNPEPVDNQITIVDSRFYLRTVVGRVVFDASNGAITNNHVLIVECNSADGVRLIGSHSTAFNTFLLQHVHAPTGIGIAIGNSSTSSVHNNFIRAFISPGTGPGPALLVWGQENLIEVLIHDGEGLVGEGIKLEPSAARNLFRVYRNTASTPVNDQSASKDNEGLFGWVKPRFFVHRNHVDQTGVPSGVATKVMFTTADFDTGNRFDFANSRWVPGRRGYVHIDAAARWLSAADATPLSIQVRKNGDIIADATISASGTVGQSPNISVTASVDAPTDYFEIFVQQSSGSARTIIGASSVTFFSGYML